VILGEYLAREGDGALLGGGHGRRRRAVTMLVEHAAAGSAHWRMPRIEELVVDRGHVVGRKVRHRH